MYRRGLINELSQKLIKSVAKRTVAKYQKTSDAARDKAWKDERTQDAASAQVSDRAADKASAKTRGKRSQARRVLAKMAGEVHPGRSAKNSPRFSGDSDAGPLGSKHGLSRKDMRGEATQKKPEPKPTRSSVRPKYRFGTAGSR